MTARIFFVGGGYTEIYIQWLEDVDTYLRSSNRDVRCVERIKIIQ